MYAGSTQHFGHNILCRNVRKFNKFTASVRTIYVASTQCLTYKWCAGSSAQSIHSQLSRLCRDAFYIYFVCFVVSIPVVFAHNARLVRKADGSLPYFSAFSPRSLRFYLILLVAAHKSGRPQWLAGKGGTKMR